MDLRYSFVCDKNNLQTVQWKLWIKAYFDSQVGTKVVLCTLVMKQHCAELAKVH